MSENKCPTMDDYSPENRTAEKREAEEAVAKTREYLWVNHGCSVATLYGDDGEMSCAICRTDFKRDPVGKLIVVSIKRLQSLLAEREKEVEGLKPMAEWVVSEWPETTADGIGCYHCEARVKGTKNPKNVIHEKDCMVLDAMKILGLTP